MTGLAAEAAARSRTTPDFSSDNRRAPHQGDTVRMGAGLLSS